ncbi:ABC transporter ATP-binding protein [Futiania mangrovi]|uniref:ABC transporter ATP-binding protein n=1 Tax=Futiania mangrovi TaxID=2959716 RepID=A0A9J6PC06_9PROT|nr:ABC transporter ATP-binding protein [Futiania mangrovii]MCP1335131.1 ABC transporter ATP-binding protein [Futiania mangrovii]
MALLTCEGVTRTFGGMVAVNEVDLHVNEGEIVGLIGPNGSGKSTMVNLITGVLPPTSGRIMFDGRDITGLPSWKINRRGISRTFQLLRLFKSLSVADNISMPLHPRHRAGLLASILGRSEATAEDEASYAQACELLDLFELRAFADRPASDLSIGQQRMVELARGIIVNPKLFVLDEPAAGLSPPNVDKLIALIRRLRDERGITILLVEHVMRVVQELCDRVIVLDYGTKIADGPPREVSEDPKVVEAYIGGGKVSRRARA